MTLAYDIEQLLTERCEIERDVATLDEFKGEAKAELKITSTPRCRFWFWKEGVRSPIREYATPERTIHFTAGGILLEEGADVRPGDHVKAVLDLLGNVLVQGRWRVTAVQQFEDHLEAALMRP